METQKQIIDRINDRLSLSANKLEGGFSQDIIGSVAYELANIYDTELNEIADKCFVLTAKGEDLDKVGADYGMPRRESQQAIVYLTITGEENATVNTTVKAIYNNLVYTVQEYKKIGASGSVVVKAKCETYGTIGNIEAETINQFITNYQGLNSVINLEPAYDGFNREDDETYRQRIKDYLAEDATNANEAQYKKWASDVVGVDKVVIKSAEVVGAGNVGVYISSLEGEVSEELKDAVYTHIDELQPINATVIVNSLNYVPVNISATVVIKDGYTTNDIKAEMKYQLKNYLNTVQNVVSYFKIAELLYDCNGVEDVINYTLNGQDTGITLEDIDFATVGGVEIVNI